uniref:Uncharacterized protein n=1 Tax=Oryza brachyantha TaxID=4533 RepID=J3NCR5_ORYBR
MHMVHSFAWLPRGLGRSGCGWPCADEGGRPGWHADQVGSHVSARGGAPYLLWDTGDAKAMARAVRLAGDRWATYPPPPVLHPGRLVESSPFNLLFFQPHKYSYIRNILSLISSSASSAGGEIFRPWSCWLLSTDGSPTKYVPTAAGLCVPYPNPIHPDLQTALSR